MKEVRAKLSQLSQNNQLLALDLVEKKQIADSLSIKIESMGQENTTLKTQLQFVFEKWQTAVKVPIEQNQFIQTQLNESQNLFAVASGQLQNQKDQLRLF